MYFIIIIIIAVFINRKPRNFAFSKLFELNRSQWNLNLLPKLNEIDNHRKARNQFLSIFGISRCRPILIDCRVVTSSK